MNFGYSQSNSTVLNNITSIMNQNCEAVCSNYESGNFVIARNTTIKGDVKIGNQSCSADAFCAMTAESDIINDVIMANQAKVQQDNITDLFNDFAWEFNTGITISKTMNKNNITMVQQSTCLGTSTNTSTGNFIYASNLKVDGGFEAFNQTGKAVANCSMSNLTKVQNFNQLRTGAGIGQSNTGMMIFIAMMVMIAAIGIAGMVALVLIFKPRSEHSGPPDCDIDAVDCSNCCDTDPCQDPCPQCSPDGTTRCKPHKSLLEHATGALDDAQTLSGKLSDASHNFTKDYNNADLSAFGMQ